MSTNPSLPQDDQARRLRELADQTCPTEAPLPVRPSHPLRAIMIGELPTLDRGLSLAWHLATNFARVGNRCLVVDLTASASRLPSILPELANPELQVPLPRIQPLWQHSAHGRTLNAWSSSSNSGIDILAQPDGDYPTAEQMQRLCEQLVRQLNIQSQQGSLGYDTVLFLSSAQGIPMDLACWQAADDVLLLWSPDSCSFGQLGVAAQSRLLAGTAQQRVVLLQSRSPTWRGWDWRRVGLRRLHWPGVAKGVAHVPLHAAKALEVCWPGSATSKVGRWRMRQTAIRLLHHLGQRATEAPLGPNAPKEIRRKGVRPVWFWRRAS